MKSILISNTTGAIVKNCQSGLNARGIPCGDCDSRDSGRVEELYKPHIDGKGEIVGINDEFRVGLIC